MKTCYTCHQYLDQSQFYKEKRNKDGLNSYCKKCYRKHHQRQISVRKEYFLHKKSNDQTKARNRNAEFVLAYLKNHPCIDCNEDDPIVLEFDHRSDKILPIATMINGCWSLEHIEQEINKCDIRCANCHRRKTAVAINSWRWRKVQQEVVVRIP